MCGDCGCGQRPLAPLAPATDWRPADSRRIDLGISLLEKNRTLAARNREVFDQRGVLVINLMSSPGSGKTRLLESTFRSHLDPDSCAVIEGDLQTARDADRIRATGVAAVQINTGHGCHLDARAVAEAAATLPAGRRWWFIENVGNLVCPAAFPLGEHRRVVLLSVTEGEDKPLKYPDLFRDADLILLTKIDLLPHLDYDLDAALGWLRQVQPRAPLLPISARSGAGMEAWIQWLNDLSPAPTTP